MADDKPNTGFFCWNELATGDVEKAKNFYTKVCGWTAEDMPMGDSTYTVLKSGGKDVAGMMAIQKDWGDVPPHWLSYIQVDNCDSATKKAVELGAKVHKEPSDIPTIGRFSVIEDPTGAVLALFTALKKD